MSPGRNIEARVYRESCRGQLAPIYDNNQRIWGSHKLKSVPKHRNITIRTREAIDRFQTVFDSQMASVLQT